jgi:predicted nucleotidyltransferase
VIATSLDLSAKPDLVWLARLVADVRIAAPETEFLLAGAQARDLLLTYAHGIDTGRATKDVDLAFMVDDWKNFFLLRKRLIGSGRFIEDTESLQKLKHHGIGASNVDVIPFAGVEDAQRHIAWPPDGGVVMNVNGFREAHDVAIAVDLPEAMSVDVPPLYALMLLKLAAWADRRVIPPLGKDAHDIRLLLKHYLEAGNQERLYTVAAHLLDRTDFDFEAAGAWLLGHDARVMLNESVTAASSVPFYLALVQREATAATGSLLLGDMRSPNPANDLRLLEAFFEGFAESRTT